MNLCGTCKFRNEKGFCDNPKLADGLFEIRDEPEKPGAIDDMLIYEYQESGRFWVGESFGCIHHENKA